MKTALSYPLFSVKFEIFLYFLKSYFLSFFPIIGKYNIEDGVSYIYDKKSFRDLMIIDYREKLQ